MSGEGVGAGRMACGWCVSGRFLCRYFVVPLGGPARVSSVDCLTGLVSGPLLLGHFALCDKVSGARSRPFPRGHSRR